MQRLEMNATTAMFTFQRYLQTSADKAGLVIKFEAELKAPYTKGKVVYIPKLNSFTSQEDMVRLLRYVNHEAAHHKYHTDFKMMQDENIDTNHLLGALFNAIEDIRVDAHDGKEWLGDAVNQSDYFEVVSDSIADGMKKLTKDPSMEMEPKSAIQAMVGMTYLANEHVPGAAINAEKILRSTTPMATEFIQGMVKGGYFERIEKLEDSYEGSAEAWQMAQEIYEHVFHLDPEKAKEEMEQQAGKDKGGKGNKGEDEGDGAAKGSEYGGDGDSTWDINPVTVKYKELAAPEAKEEYGGSGIHLDYSDYSEYDVFVPAAFDDMGVVDYERDTAKNVDMRNDPHMGSIDVDKVQGKALANKVRRLLQIRSKTQHVYGQKKGKIHARNLHRVTMTEAHGFNQRVFKQRIENDTLDTAVSLLVDFSGSMHGDKIKHAVESAILLYEAISKSLKIPLEIIGFTDRGDKSIMMVFKSFDGKISEEKLMERMRKGTSYMSGNADGEAIAWTYDRLQRRREKKKLMVVLSDGSPACSRYGDIYKYTKDVVEQIESARKADIVGIGIMDTNVKRFYANHQVINRSDELEGAILQLIEKRIING